MADALLASIGQVEWIEDEALIDPVTAVSGSGPAYVFLLVECLAEAGAKVAIGDVLDEQGRKTAKEIDALYVHLDVTSEASWAEAMDATVEKYGKPQRRSYEGGVDVVINFTGGDTWHPSLRCLKRGGKLLVCGATAGYDPKEDLRYVWSFELKIIGSNSFYDEDLKGLMDLIQQGKMKPVIDKVLPLDEAREGLRLIRDREVVGKVVVAP